MSKINYRLAKSEDIDRIWELRMLATEQLKNKEVDQWQFEDPTIASFQHEIDKKRLYVLEQDQKVIGMFALIIGIEPTYAVIDGLWHHDLPYATIHKLALDPNHQHHGMAFEMLKAAERIALKNGIRYMRIDTHRDNLQAQSLFLRVGYVYCGDIEVDILRGDRHRYAYDKLLEVQDDCLY